MTLQSNPSPKHWYRSKLPLLNCLKKKHGDYEREWGFNLSPFSSVVMCAVSPDNDLVFQSLTVVLACSYVEDFQMHVKSASWRVRIQFFLVRSFSLPGSYRQHLSPDSIPMETHKDLLPQSGAIKSNIKVYIHSSKMLCNCGAISKWRIFSFKFQMAPLLAWCESLW